MQFRIILCSVLLMVSPALADTGGNTGAWTEQQVVKLCHYRASTNRNPNDYQRCMDRNVSKIGKAKQPGEATILNNADARLSAKAAQKTTDTNTK